MIMQWMESKETMDEQTGDEIIRFWYIRFFSYITDWIAARQVHSCAVLSRS